MGFGATVTVDGKLVKYICKDPFERYPMDSDQTRQSVDAGVWDGKVGEFAEIKLSPEGFHTKDIKYLRLLSKTLIAAQIEYKIYLIAFGNKNLIQYKLNQLSLWDDGEFHLIGYEELKEF